MEFGIERFCKDSRWIKKIKNQRVALLAHPASVDGNLHHSLELFIKKRIRLVSVFGPQHGMLGDKQDNMIESEDYIDPVYKIPVFSLYGQVRRPTEQMMNTFDVIFIDLQDVGTRIYTYVTTLKYVLEEAARLRKTVVVLDRPNPIGRPVEGTLLREGYESFVGAGPLPMRHGLTMGELALWFGKSFKLELDLQIVKMKAYFPDKKPGFGWPLGRTWVNPSPNASHLNMARCFPGTVLLEGTHLSEGRGTTRPLEMVGAPGLPCQKILSEMEKMKPEWLMGAKYRLCHFLPMFQKHEGKICSGIHIHTDHGSYQHTKFRPYRWMALFFKALRKIDPDFEIWRDFHYEYEKNRLAIDLINGSPILREWVEDSSSRVGDFDKILMADEKKWIQTRKPFLLYR
jgi:uncharacterized protein YbbC (DUF1343 family)